MQREFRTQHRGNMPECPQQPELIVNVIWSYSRQNYLRMQTKFEHVGIAWAERTSCFLSVCSSCMTPGAGPGLRSFTNDSKSSSFSSASRFTAEGFLARHKTSDITCIRGAVCHMSRSEDNICSLASNKSLPVHFSCPLRGLIATAEGPTCPPACTTRATP